MRLILRMATRNLFRQVSRNALSMVSIILGVVVIIVGRGFQEGLNENMIRASIDASTGHVIAVPEGYPETGFRQPVDGAYDLEAEDRAWLDANTTAWTPRLIATPRAIVGRDSLRVRMIGVSETDATVFPRDDWRVEGALPDVGQVLVAVGPANLLDLTPGDVLTLETRTVDGAMNAMRYTVSGLVKASNPMIDNITVFLPFDTADALLNARGRVTHVATRLHSRDRAEDFAPRLADQLDGVHARTWTDEVGAMIEAQSIRQTMFDILGLAVLGMAAAGIANTVLMAAFERVREIGTLRSMGLRRRGVLGLFAVEGAWLGVLGGAIGVLLGGTINAWYAREGFDITAMMAGKDQAMDNLAMSARLYLSFDPWVLVGAFAVSVVVSVLASIYPAIAASRISPAEAVRAA